MILDSISHVHKSQPALTDSFSHTLVSPLLRFVIIDTAPLLSAKGAHWRCFFGFIPRDVFFGRPLPRRERLCWTLFRTTLAPDGSSSPFFFLHPSFSCCCCMYVCAACIRWYIAPAILSASSLVRYLSLCVCVCLL